MVPPFKFAFAIAARGRTWGEGMDNDQDTNSGRGRLDKIWGRLSDYQSPEMKAYQDRILRSTLNIAYNRQGVSDELFFALFKWFPGDWAACVNPEISNWVATELEKSLKRHPEPQQTQSA